MSLTDLILLVVKISIVLCVLDIGLKATFSNATFLLRRPVQLGRLVLSMYVVMPVVALILASAFNLNPAVKIALVALSVSPVPPILPNKAFKAGGTEDYTIGMLVASSVIAVILIPVMMEVFQLVTGIPLRVTETSVAAQVLGTILVPLVVGIIIRSLAPSFAEKIARPLGIVGLILLLLGVLPVLIKSIGSIISLIGDGTLVSLAAFAIVGLITGHLLGGPEPDNRPVLALATATRHPAVAIGIAQANFPEQKLAIPAVFLFLLLSGILSIPYLNWLKREKTVSDRVKV